jgi:2-polyprenyl-3-methyl-5-hydroxy-6-metoxy-1,4-benzoquinol methylase
LNKQSAKNKKAWEYRAYEFWNNQGTPGEKAQYIIKDPMARLRYYQKYFENIVGLKIANPCGSNGRIAVPLALMGADVTIFDISNENQKYALELAACAGVSIDYILGDFYDVPLEKYSDFFDIAYMEGGILHYFDDIDKFMQLLYKIIKTGGKLILSDFHPFRKILMEYNNGAAESTNGDYFDGNTHNGNVAYKSFFPENEFEGFPDCELRFYTLSEIINAVINAGFVLKEFNEHPKTDEKKLPGEFTIFAFK